MKPKQNRSGSKVMDRNKSQPNNDSQMTNSEVSHESNPDEGIIPLGTCLKYTANNLEIIEAMKNPLHGLSFINGHTNLPSTTFIAADAVHWLKLRMEGISTKEKAVKIMNNLHAENLIQHASGDSSKAFTYGFYLFYITDKDIQLSYDLQVFENEWLEVEIKSALNWGLTLKTNGVDVPNKFSDRIYGVPHFLCEDINTEYAENDYNGQMYKRMRLETDVAGKSDRVEWGHVRYQTVFMPDQAYELIIEWLTSSGSIIAELLSSWHRKAAQICGLQMIPIPHDPLALPYSNKSDPLRGPIFVPLNIKDLEDKHGLLFREFDEGTYLDRMFLFQEAIVQRFGFINCMLEPPNNPDATSREHHYVHNTGTIFILISRSATKPRSRIPSVGSKNRSSARITFHNDVVPSPHEAYITRHVSGKNKDDYDNSRKLGFLWSWNHMVSRRWRTNPAVDTNFQTRLLKDFREFCANIDNRLDKFWDESWVTKENRCLDKYQKIL